jgi:UDP-glucose 4-epimerase
MRVLVTGGAGFIGSHIVDLLLADGHAVLVADDLSSGKAENLPPAAELVQVDIGSPEFLEIARSFNPQAITHAAAQPSVVVSMARPADDARVNILGGLNVARAGIECGVRDFLYITTGGALYGQPVYTPSDEDHPIRPISPYGLSKWTLECYLKIVLPAAIRLKVLRLSNVYGPRQDPFGEAGVIAIFSARMLRGEPAMIYGDGEQTRDFVYVGDVARAHQLALGSGGPLTVNVSSEAPLSVNELFRLMAAETGYAKPAVYEPERPGEIKHVVLANGRARQVLGWSPETAMAAGLRATIDSLR